MELIISKRRKYKVPIIIFSSIAVVIAAVTASILIYVNFFYGTGPVAGCEKKAFNTEDLSATGNYYVCKKELFTFQVHEDIAYQLPNTYLEDFHKWFKEEVTYGPEITTFRTIRLSTWATEVGTLKVGAYADYSPQSSHINVYYDAMDSSLTTLKNFYSDTTLNRYDLRLWKYTVAHEYGHHSTVKNMTNNKIEKRNGVDDVVLTKNGENFFVENKYSLRPEYNLQGITAIRTDAESLTQSFNNYYWSYAEMMTRELQTYTLNGRESQRFVDDKLTSYWGGSFQDVAWRKAYNILGYDYADKKGTTLKAGQTNTDAIKNHVFGANDTPLHAVYYDQSIGYVLNTPSKEYALKDSKGNQIKPTSSNEYSNFWYNQTFLDGNTKQEFDQSRYALVFKDLTQGNTYELDLKGDEPTNAGMGLAENDQVEIFNPVSYSNKLVTVRRGTGNKYTIQVH